jgi:hypothetical protein
MWEMSEEVFKTTCRKYVIDKCLQSTRGANLSSQTQATIETRAMLNAIIEYIDLYFPVKDKKEGEPLRGRPKNVVQQLIIEHNEMKKGLEYYRDKDILSLAEAKRNIEGKPWLNVPSLADWSVAHRCLQELEAYEE